MGLLSYNRLIKLIELGIINAPIENVNGASIDVTLHNEIRREQNRSHNGPMILIPNKPIDSEFSKFTMPDRGYLMSSGECILASTNEIFNLPDNIAAEYKLKSSMGRIFLNSMLANWCDPTWNNSQLTLELKNECRFHEILLLPGMKIGQIVFWECDPVPEERSYAKRGQYNGQRGPVNNGGIR